VPEAPEGPVAWVVDASNVIGARPDGWWRDRAGATVRLRDALARFAQARGEDVTMVVDGPAPDLAEGRPPGVAVVAAPRPRRDAADDEIVRLVAAAPEAGGIRVVTSDAALGERVRALGAAVEGAGSFRRRLDV
jgi:uncharacterized protein YaiI (UPF0178 family)